MTKTFVQLNGKRIKRISNRMDGEGNGYTDPMAVINRRRERRNQMRELDLLLADPDGILFDEDSSMQPEYHMPNGVDNGVNNRGRSKARDDNDFYQPDSGRLRLQRSAETGMLTFASYSAWDNNHHRRRSYY